MNRDNAIRTRDAEVCLATFTALTGEEGRHAVIDLVVNLGHLCDRDGTQFPAAPEDSHWSLEG